ncbi:glycosyltransferase family protein [Oceanirhabdus sp. W0125-5]|uniref:glycosyltransferase family protein n=1 Tax=Oceanirhabdus sp. W0125-5 TaxID=2999116 RepID=UPI0022F30964|nr:glycosyltransferase [Oceanirhabdus sp. W0125-5]WBW96637.1 glycosyltransferase [Oceanirhabdus sp. W0125-5]
MKKLKILFITKDFSKHLVKDSYYFSNALSKISDLVLWHNPGNIREILNHLKLKPDFILLNDLRPTRCPKITGLSNLTIPFGIIMHDLHYRPNDRIKFVRDNNVKYIFSIYRDEFYRRFPFYKNRMYWIPHFIEPNTFKDYGLPKTIDYLMMGAIANTYPLRAEMLSIMKKEPGFVYHKHPGYRNIENPKEFAGTTYAKEINKAKIFLTDGLIYHYPVMKYYEVLACNTLLLAPKSKELLDLGFLPGKHFVSVHRRDFLQKSRYYLAHEEERKEIAKNGFEMVHAKHSAAHRANQFIQMVEKILKK